MSAVDLVFVVGLAITILGSMAVFVVVANRVIGRHYDELAARVMPLVEAEGILAGEDDAGVRGRWIAPLAIGIRWGQAHVRVTSRAFYVFQFRRLPFGAGRMGQPILALVPPGGAVDPRIAGYVRAGVLTAPPRVENAALVLEGTLGVQRFSLRVTVRSFEPFLRAMAARG